MYCGASCSPTIDGKYREYTRASLHIPYQAEGTFDFPLKPLNNREPEESIRMAVGQIQREAEQTLELQRMERLSERGMPLIRSRYFLSPLFLILPVNSILAGWQQIIQLFQAVQQRIAPVVEILIETSSISKHAVLL